MKYTIYSNNACNVSLFLRFKKSIKLYTIRVDIRDILVYATRDIRFAQHKNYLGPEIACGNIGVDQDLRTIRPWFFQEVITPTILDNHPELFI